MFIRRRREGRAEEEAKNVNCYLTLACFNEFWLPPGTASFAPWILLKGGRREEKKARKKEKFKLTPHAPLPLFTFLGSFFPSSFPFIQIPIDANCEHPFMLIFSINFWFHTQWVSTSSLRCLFQPEIKSSFNAKSVFLAVSCAARKFS